jgi:hypothetical protein
MAVAVVFTALFVPSFLGQEELNIISPAEVRASEHFYDHARSGSVLLLSAPGFPYRYGERYPVFRGPEGDANPNLMTEPYFENQKLGAASVPRVISRIREYARHGYIVFSEKGFTYARIFRMALPGSLVHLEAAIAKSPNFRLWYRNKAARIYELVQKHGS